MHADLLELCEIVVERNRLAKLRGHYRHKERRLKELFEAVVHNYKRKKLKQFVRATQPNKLKKLIDLEDHVCRVMGNSSGVWRMRNIIKEEEAQIHSDQARAVVEIEHMGEFKHLPKKHAKTKQDDVRISLMELDVEYSKVKLDIALFTKRTQKTVRRILRKHSIHMHADGNNGISGIMVHNGSPLGDLGYLSLKEIVRIHEDNMFEKEILGAS
jgi:hypothetical protein